MPVRPAMLYPLRFEPIFKTALWGGARLRPFLGAPDANEPTGEAWVLSDQGDSLSVVADGPLRGATLRDLMEQIPQRLLGRPPEAHGRFPLLCKFLDARQPLSVQVHPNDEQAARMTPTSKGPNAGLGKTEAWVILQAEPDALLYAGLRPGVTREKLLEALRAGSSFALNAGDVLDRKSVV